MELTEQKPFPEAYPHQVMSVLNAMAIEKKHIKLVGSMSIRSQLYAGDYDANEIVSGSPSSLAKGFQKVIKDVRSMSDVFIGDIKIGEVEEWRVLQPEAGIVDGKVVGFDLTKSLDTLQSLWRNKIISPQERKSAEELLKRATNPYNFLVCKDTIKFHILRWSIETILAGKQSVRGKTITLEEAWASQGVKKLDCIAKDGDRFTEYSMIYIDKNTRQINVEQSLKEDIYYYSASRHPFKALKRSFALAKLMNNTEAIKQITPILNSDLGRLYHIISDIYTLVALLEYKHAPLAVIQTEIDRFRFRMSQIYSLKDYLKNEKNLFGDIFSILKLPKARLGKRLDTLGDTLSAYLTANTYRVLDGKDSITLPRRLTSK